MRFPSSYVLLVLAPLALSMGCSSRSLFKGSSDESVFSFKKKEKTLDAEKAAEIEAEKKAELAKKADPSKKDDKSLAKAKDKEPSKSAASQVARAQELEKNGDYEGAGKIYRELSADEAKKKGDTRTAATDDKSKAKGDKAGTRTAAASKEDQPKTLAKKPDEKKTKTDSSDPWLEDPLPSTRPKSEKSSPGTSLANKPSADKSSADKTEKSVADGASAKPDWAKRASDPKTSQADRAMIETALKSGDPEELDELADLLDLDEAGADKKPVNKFAQRDAEKNRAEPAAAPKKNPKTIEDALAAAEGPTTSSAAEEADKPAWAKNRPAPSADEETPFPEGNRPLPSTMARARPEPAKAPAAAPEEAPESEAPWRATRLTEREKTARGEPFEKPVARVAAADPEVPKQTFAAPVLGETADVPVREGWNATSMVRLCRDCDPLVLAQVKKLDNKYPDVRKDGIIELARMGSIARPAGLALRALLDDPDSMVQAYAAWGLWELENNTLDSVQVLGGLLGNDRPEVVELACYSLGSMGSTANEAVPALEDLRDHDPGVGRLRAAEALIRVQGADARSVEVLSVAIQSQDKQVRWIAANGLGHVRGPQAPKAVETLMTALGDADPEVQAAAALALGGMGEPALKALPKLDELRQAKVPFVQSAADSAIKCLARI